MSVAIVKYDDTPNALRKAITLCDGFEKLKKGSKILLKPNTVWGSNSKKIPKYGFITTARIMEELIQLLSERGCKDISIGEGTIVNEELGSDTFQGYKWSGIERVAKKYGVKLIDFNQESHKKVELDGTEIGIAHRALESDFLVNIPVLKTHAQTKVSLGLKNLKGCLTMNSKMEFHKKGLERLISLLNMHIKPDLTIIDGIYALEQGPDFLGTAHRMNVIIVGRDNLSCDIVGSMVMGIDPSSIEHLKEYTSIAKRSLDINTIDLKGEKIKGVTKKLKWDRDPEDILRQTQAKGISFQSPGKHLCSCCVINIESVMIAFLKDVGAITLDKVEICCGAEVNPKKESKKVFLIGNCAIQANKDLKDAIRVKGCPPKVADTFIAIVNHTLNKKRARTISLVRLLKQIAHNLGIYDESFPAFKRYKSPEFDENHF